MPYHFSNEAVQLNTIQQYHLRSSHHALIGVSARRLPDHHAPGSRACASARRHTAGSRVAAYRAPVRARDHHAESSATGDHDGAGACLSPAHSARPSEAAEFEPLMTLYLTDHTPPEEIRHARASGIVHAIKLYPAGATTHSDAGVTELSK